MHQQSVFDAAVHRPGYRILDEWARDYCAGAREVMLHRLGDAWRGDAAAPDIGQGDDDPYQAFKHRLANAWRNDPKAANAIEQQAEAWRHGA
jgi:hypothetical protein